MLVAFLGILSFFSKSINHNFNDKQYKLQKSFIYFYKLYIFSRFHGRGKFYGIDGIYVKFTFYDLTVKLFSRKFSSKQSDTDKIQYSD